MRVMWRMLAAVAWCAASFGLGCTEAKPAPKPQTLRIVSLSPALTRTAMDLGAGGAIVGRTPWCAATEAPIVGTLNDCDLAKVSQVQPTLLLVQSNSVDPALLDVAKKAGAEVFLHHIDSLTDIIECVRTLAGTLEKHGVAGARARADALLADHERAVADGRAALSAAGPTLILFSVEPATAFGGGTYVGDLWRAMGGTNAITREGYPELRLEDIVTLDPARIVVVRTSSAELPPEIAALPARLQARARAIAAPALLEPSTEFLRTGPAALKSGVKDPQ